MKSTLTFCLILTTAILFAQSPEIIPRHDGYYSNYFSFHGADSLGKVYFAIDNNRERTKKKYKANNFLYFNVDNEWIKLKGHENFVSDAADIEMVPSSEHFDFLYEGDDLTGITSPTNGIELTLTEPLEKVGDYGQEGMLFEIYTAEATMRYQDRVVEGNVISERLIDSVGLKTFGNMMKVVFGGFKFDGYYLNVEGLGDLYIHLVETPKKVSLFQEDIYNLTTDTETIELEIQRSDYKVTKSKGIGLKRLALDVEIDLRDAKLKLHTVHFHKYRNLFFFAFGMGAVEGELEYQGKTYRVYGVSELFKF